MKIKYIFLLIVVLTKVLADVCDKTKADRPVIYFCDKELMDNKCVVFENILNQQLNVYVKDICGKDEYCEEVSMSFCKIRNDKLRKYPGEKCGVNPECHSMVCTNGICEGLPNGATCSSLPRGCKGNLYCNSDKTCVPLLTASAFCSSDYDCPINHVCDVLTFDGKKQCLKMFSIKTGTFSPRALLCESGFLYEPTNFKYQRLYIDRVFQYKATSVCAESKLNSKTCKVSDDCTYNITTGIELPNVILKGGYECKCDGKGIQGYCMLGSEDEIYKNYLTLYKYYVEGMELGENDNIASLRDTEWGFPQLIQANKNIQYSQILNNIEKCAIRYATGSNAITYSSIALVILIALF